MKTRTTTGSIALAAIFSTVFAVQGQDTSTAAQAQYRIVFTSNRDAEDGSGDIYIMNSDGSGVTRLTNDPADEFSPCCSPDGKRIAFVHETKEHSHIYLMDCDGSNQTDVTPDLDVTGGPSWSPNGKAIAFSSERDGNEDINIMNADGSAVRRVASYPKRGGPHVSSSCWSPDGRKIAFTSVQDGNPEIYVVNSDGSDLKRLTSHPKNDGFPSWSPDGRTIAFMSDRDGNPDINVMNADGSDVRRLVDHPKNDGFPSWSPDGKKIAFVSSRDENPEIYVVNADGTEQKRLTDNPAVDVWPCWCPVLDSAGERREEAANGNAAASDFTAEDYVNFAKRSVGEWKTKIVIGNETVAEGTWSRQPTPTRGCFVSKATTKGHDFSLFSIEGYDPGSRSWKTTTFYSDGSHCVLLHRAASEDLKRQAKRVVFEVESTRTSSDGKVLSEKSTLTSTFVNQDRMELLTTTKANGDRPPEEIKIVFEREKE